MFFCFLCFSLHCADSLILRLMDFDTRPGANLFFPAPTREPDATTTCLGSTSHVQIMSSMVSFGLGVWSLQPLWYTSSGQPPLQPKILFTGSLQSIPLPHKTPIKTRLMLKACFTKSYHMLLILSANIAIQCSATYNPEASSSLFQAPGVTSTSLQMLPGIQIICRMKPLCWPQACTWLLPLTLFWK